jgi:putative ABC transport system permease protein
VLQDLRYALRTLARSPGLSLAAVLTLGLGIGANSAMFGVVDRLFFRPPAHVVDPDRVVRLYVTTTDSPWGTNTSPIGTYPRYEEFRDRARSFAGIAAYGRRSLSFGLGPQAEPVTSGLVTASFFSVLGVRPELGRFFGADEDSVGRAAHVAVLSREFWKRRFGADRAVLGKTLQLGRNVYTVIGVAPQGFAGIDLEVPDLWLPLTAVAPEVIGPDALGPRYFWLSGVVARLRPRVSPEQAAAEATAIYRSEFVQSGDSTGTISLGSVHEAIGPLASRDAKLSVWLGAMCAIVLLIACANVANLLLARAVQRKREIAIRLALGASRGRLARQLLADSAVLGVLGGVAALFITLWVGPVLSASLLSDSTTTAGLDTRVLLFAAVAVLVTVVLAGFAPAYYASAPDLSSALKSGEREGTFQRSPVRTGLLVGQVALTLVLLTGAGLFVSSLRHVQGLRLGFDADRLIVASVDLQRLGYKRAAANALYEDMRERVKRLPGVSGASLAVGHPFGWAFVVTLFVPGLDSLPRAPSGGPYFEAVTPDYFRTMGAVVRRGRALVPTDIAGAQRVAVVNETMARRYWPGQDPLGKCLRIISPAAPCTEVVGVVEDARLHQVTDEGGAIQYFIPLAQADSVTSSPVTALLVRTNGPADALVGAVRRTIQETAADLPYPSIDPMPRLFASQLRPWRLGSVLLSLFGALGLVLSAIGLYGVHSYVVSQRTQEMGIRIALGAGRREILQLIMGQALRVTGWGLVLGAAGALAVGRAIASLLYGVKPHDPLVLSLVMVILGAVAAVASYLPARRATKVDPMVALRYE